jgi:phage shock protein PspC (stress-responsive transcriptional regulator)
MIENEAYSTLIFYICSMNQFRHFFEWQLFGVCTKLGERFNISITRIRMWFIYISFLTFGSPIILYFILAFWVNLKAYILSARRNPLRWF